MKPIEREYGYFKNQPVMVLKAGGNSNQNRFIIKLEDLWKYSDTHNELFESFMANQVMKICVLLGITVPKGEALFVNLMASVATIIMDGIDALVKMPPYREDIDDPEMIIDGNPHIDVPDLKVRMM